MQDRDNSALPLGDIHHGAQDSPNSLIVVATIAAIFLAGSAIVYRTRPTLPYLPFASPASADDPAAPYHTDKKRRTAGEASRDELNAAASGSGSLLPAGSTASESDSLLALGSKEKEGKSSRSKDRRRRGKDPLKELLKGGGKKYKALTLAVSAHTEKDTSPSHNNVEDPLSESDSNNPSSSLSFASTSFLPDSPSRATTKGKRVQREKSAVATTTTDTPANASMAAQSAAALSMHNTYSRGPSEVSQKHNRMGDGPSSASGSLENHSHPSQTVPDAHNSFADDRPPSSLDSASLSHSDDGHGRPHSSLSMADSTSSSLLPLAEDQAPHMEDEPFNDNPVRRSRAKGKNRPDNLTGLAFSRSPSASTANTTTTGATASASLSSSVLLINPDVLTPATSPTLSTYASGSGSGSGSGSTQSTLTEHPKPSGAPELSDSPSAGKSKNSKRKAAEQGASSKNGSKDATVSERGSSSTKDERKLPTPAAVKSMASSSSHPSLLYSPTKTSFAAAAAAAASASSSTLSSSVSASITSATGRSSPLVGVDEHKEDGNDKREEEETFTFPTLNPTPVTERFDAAGPSRLRSDISSPRRAPTPRRPGTPSRSSNTSTPPPLMSPTTASFSAPAGSSSSSHANSNHSNTNSSMPALSTQTQLASLRGALEAARLREEKNKSEMERVGKEMEALRWENVNWRRAESELQTHIRHLMHQVQTYAFLLSSMAPHVNPQVLQQQYQQYAQLHQQQLLQLQQQGLQPPPAPMHPQPPTSGAANPGGANAGSTPSSTSSAPNVNASPNITNANTGSSGGAPASVPSTPLDASFASPSSTSMASPIVTPGGSSQAQGQTTQNQSPQQQTPTQTQQPTTTTVPPVLPPLHIQQQMATAQMNGMPSSAARAVGTPPPHLPMMGMHPGSPTPAPFFPYAIPPPPPPHGYPHLPGHPHAPFSPHLPTHTPHTHPAQALMLQAQQMQQQFQQAAGGSSSAPHTPNMSMNMFSGMFSPPVMSPHQMHQYPAYAAAVAAQAQMQQMQAAATAAAVTNSASSSSSNSNSTSTSSAASSLLSMSMGTLSMSGSGPSSASSPGSLSPDLNASPSPGGGKKRRTRLGRGRSTWGDAGDGWIGGGIEGEKSAAGEEGADAEVNGHARDSGDDEGCSDDVFNEIVADAIFKRPASLGVRSSLKRGKLRGEAENAENDKRDEKPERLTEFTFPSLSDLGNVKYQFRGNMVAVNGGGSNSSVGGSTPSSSSVSVSASVSRSMSISPVPQENVPEASGVEKNEEVKEEVAVEVEAEVDLVTEAVPTVGPEQPAEEKSAPGHPEVAEVLYDSSTSTDDTPRKETSEPSIPVAEPDSSFHETPATAADISSPQEAQ